jgi:hypothetical protein
MAAHVASSTFTSDARVRAESDGTIAAHDVDSGALQLSAKREVILGDMQMEG